MRSILIICLLLLLSMPLWAQECDNSQHELSLPTERFDDNGDGTVTDKGTGSIWMRCTLGQEWDGKTCTGEAKLYTWAELETLADEFNLDGYAGNDDWRLPNLPELATITERTCKNSRTNEEVFPNTLHVAYWTSMAKPGTEQIYVLNFGEGGVKGADKTYRGPVRMLRGEKWWFPPSVRELREQEKNQ
jgi:hypothetical protein